MPAGRRSVPRIPYLAGLAIAAILAVAPIGTTTVLLLLSLTLELALVLMLVREHSRRPVPAAISPPIEHPAPVYLIRRMVPRLRARRPFGIVQEQVRWRVRAEAHRRRGLDLRLAGEPPRDRQR
jgi:hypothetical protein